VRSQISETAGLRESFTGELNALCRKLKRMDEYSRDVAAGPGEALDEPLRDRVEVNGETHNRQTASRRARSAQRRLVACGNQDVRLARGKLAETLFISVNARGSDKLKNKALVFLITKLLHSVAERDIEWRIARLGADESDAHCPAWRLRMRYRGKRKRTCVGQ